MEFVAPSPAFYIWFGKTVANVTVVEAFLGIGRIAPGALGIVVRISTEVVVHSSFWLVLWLMGVISAPFLASVAALSRASFASIVQNAVIFALFCIG